MELMTIRGGYTGGTATSGDFHAAFKLGADHWEVQRFSDPERTIVRIDSEPLADTEELLAALLEYKQTQPAAEPAAERPADFTPAAGGTWVGPDGTLSKRRRGRR